MFRNFLIWLGLVPTEEERKIIEALKQPWNKSCRVVGRGTLVKDAEDIIKNPAVKKFRKEIIEIFERK